MACGGDSIFAATCQLFFVTPLQCRKEGNEREREADKDRGRQNFVLIHPSRHA